MSLSGAYAKIGSLQMDLTRLQRRLEEQEARVGRFVKREEKAPAFEEGHEDNQEVVKVQDDKEWKQMVISNLEDQARMLTRLRAALEVPRENMKAEAVFAFLVATWIAMFFY